MSHRDSGDFTPDTDESVINFEELDIEEIDLDEVDFGEMLGISDNAVLVDFESDEESSDRPQYGGDHGRRYSKFETVGTDEYVDSTGGVERIYHNDQDRTTDTVSDIPDNAVGAPSNQLTTNTNSHKGFKFEDPEGDLIDARLEDGTVWLRMVPVDAIIYPGDPSNQIRKGSLNTFALESSIDQVGLLEPIHVIPFGAPIGYEQDEDEQDILELPIYAKYVLLHGRRRYESVVNLGWDNIISLVDTTIPFPLIEVFQPIAHHGEAYTFSEKMGYVRQIRVMQPNMSPDLIETALGYKTGELPKAEYIDQMKVDYPDIYTKVEQGRLTIEQGFKAIEKEADKKQKELDKAASGEFDEQDVEDALRDKQTDELDELNIDVNQQELGQRTILDAPVRRAVESRDKAMCQACGYGDGIPDLSNMFSVHHMVPVQYGGNDSVENLILLCQNCHKMAHDYELGRIVITQDTYQNHDFIKKVVALGNILRKSRQIAIKTIRTEDPAMGRRMDKGSVTVGRALKKSNIKLKVQDTEYEGSPYKAFMRATERTKFGGGITGELGELEFEMVDRQEPNVDDGDLSIEDLLLDAEIEEQDSVNVK